MLIPTMNDAPGHARSGRMVAPALSRGGNAVLAQRFGTPEMGRNEAEICAYGTAVVIEPIG
ncbi:MAG: heavy metal-binding domain-containing protein [Acidimicrobiales bacterium]